MSRKACDLCYIYEKSPSTWILSSTAWLMLNGMFAHVRFDIIKPVFIMNRANRVTILLSKDITIGTY